jgi:hypothetical protein
VRESPKIRLTPSLVQTGKYSATLAVTDIYGLETKVTYKYEVLPNTAPVLVKSFDNIVFDSKAAEVKELVTAEYFNDEDGEEPTYTFEFSNPDIANMTYSDGKFQITSMNYGVSEIKVTGTDVRGETVSQALKVLVRSGDKPLSLYPNPVHDMMYVRVGDDVSQLSLKMISSLGTVAYSAELGAATPFDETWVDLSELKAGSYTAVVVMDGEEYKQQVVKL